MVFTETGDSYPVKWYFTDDDANAFPGFHAFGSANWVNRNCEAGELGEQPGIRFWRDGNKPANGFNGNADSVACAESLADWWTDGIPSGESFGPYNPAGVPLCCTGAGACSAAAFDTLTAEITDIAGCGNLGTPSSLNRIDPGVCKWLGTFSSAIGDAAAAVEFVGGTDWILNTSCHTDPIAASAPFVSGGTVSFTVDDEAGCCDQPTPPRSYTFKVFIP